MNFMAFSYFLFYSGCFASIMPNSDHLNMNIFSIQNFSKPLKYGTEQKFFIFFQNWHLYFSNIENIFSKQAYNSDTSLRSSYNQDIKEEKIC